MKFLINDKKQAQCPSCNQWNDLVIESRSGIYHEFVCCGRNFVIAINKENLEKIAQGNLNIDEPEPGWFINKEEG